MEKSENLEKLVSAVTKSSKFMIFDNNNVLTNAGLNNPNLVNITENGTYYFTFIIYDCKHFFCTKQFRIS